MTARIARILTFAVLGALTGACIDTPAEPIPPETSFLAVMPRGGGTAVSTTAPIVIQFSGPMQPQMSVYASLHEGDATGPAIACAAAWSGDSTVLTLTPMNPLMSNRMYTLHLGGGMTDVHGSIIDMMQHGGMMGGQWATGTIMGAGMMGSGGGEMGHGWQGPNGMYGMVFRFTTF
ncbi:MAG TPA: Ig-like domain-containing protein [Gemmatimonadales bacterium]|nr:Ig-like domain-containing protein [Gemmatimonadales bacterium]